MITSRKYTRALITACSVVAVGLAGFSATAVADSAESRPPAQADGLTPDVLAAMKRDLGLSAEQAKQRMATQAESFKADKALSGKLGKAYAGSWLDAKSGELIVAVTDAGKRSTIQAAGAEARVVKHSDAKLDGIVAELDRLSGKTADARGAKGKRSAEVAGLAAWHADPTTNSVVVSVVKGKKAAAAAKLAKFGDAVRVTEIAAPTTTDFMDGGDEINGATCSAGFNLRSPSTGQGYLLTAGHCVSAGQTVYGQGWNTFGTVSERWFPGVDDALIRKTNSYWTQGPWIDTNPSNGGYVNVYGFTDAPVGTLICKSGIKTKLTCGYIRGKDETVTFDGVNTVYGLTRHDACVEKGDSGGANYQYASTRTAEGVSSGASLYGTAKRCGSAVGQPTVSWYFPIADSMAYYGPKYGIQVW